MNTKDLPVILLVLVALLRNHCYERGGALRDDSKNGCVADYL